MKKNNKGIIKCVDGATIRQPFTFPYTQEEIDQIAQSKQMQPTENPYAGEIAKLPPYMQSGMSAGAERMQAPQMAQLQSAPIQPLPNNFPSQEPLPLADTTQPATTEQPKSNQTGKMIGQAAAQVGQVAGQIFSGAYAAIPALTSLIPDQKNRKIRPEMEQAYTQNRYGNTDGRLYANGGAIKYKTVKRNVGGIEITEEVPDFGNETMPVQENVQNYVQPEPFPVPPNEQKITYEKLNYGNQQRYSPVFNGTWSNNDREQAFSNGTIPSNYQGIPVNTQSDWRELWNGVNQFTDSNQWYSSGTPVNRTVRDITTNMGSKAKPKIKYPFFKNGGKLEMNQETELSAAEIAHYKSLGYKFK